MLNRHKLEEMIRKIIKESDEPETVKISNMKRNIMGTLSFDMKVEGMKLPQDFIVYPMNAGDTSIKIQSDKRFGRLNLSTGEGIMNKKNVNNASSIHLSRGDNMTFKLTSSQLSSLKSAIKSTGGKSVGNAGISSDNSGAMEL
jgi:hypothetical protein